MREMKDSGIEWIGEIPVNWAKTRIRNLFRFSSGDSLTNEEIQDEGLYKVYGANGPRGYYHHTNLAGKHILIGRVGALCGNIHIVDEPVWVTEHALIAEQISPDVCTDFAGRVFESMNLGQYSKASAQPVIASSVVQRLQIPIPPSLEQRRIADYLDRKCSQIDAIIARQQEVIEKLKAYKLSVITEVVTKGLNPDVPMKDSGIEWIGKIPEHWIVSQLKYYASLRSGLTLGKKYLPDSKLIEVPYLRVANVQGDYIKLDDVATVFVQQEEIDKYSLHKGELLLTEGGDRDKLGRGCIWNGEIQPCLHQNHVFAVTTDTGRLSTEYLNYVTSSNVARTYFDYTAKKTTNLASTNSTTILQFKLPIPPIEEQGTIVSYLDTKCAKINSWLNNTELVISKLQDYKKSLIYEVVTGKKEV